VKKLGKAILCYLLERQAKRLRRRHDFLVVAVAGSVGKTSTKLAIAKTLSASRRVIYQDGNYNDRLTVPLVLFGQTEPGIFNIAAWLRILASNRRAIQNFHYDVAILELGTDASGQLAKFAYLKPELCVITAVADEHMEFFKTLDEVTREELMPLKFSKQALLNVDDIASKFLPKADYKSYGLASGNFTVAQRQSLGLNGQKITFQMAGDHKLSATVPMLGDQGAKIALAAVAVANLVGLSDEEIGKGLQRITPVPGRMQVLPGKNNSIILDDTYNSSPPSVAAALDVLQKASAPQRIAILGSMNELGATSAAAHQAAGALCDPDKINLVVTIGAEAKRYLAPAATKRGCQVMSFDSSRAAGEYVAGQLQEGAVVLAKGSQNGVFAEEAIKSLLANPADAAKLVRQSPDWMKIKRQQFADIT
jgi:UDP-N-acetylmuramoyl-tripeptide--D-alanyl-D-alanine ligase